MKTTNKLAVAALTGLLGLGIMGAGIAHAAEGGKMEKVASSEKAMEKHACKGQNACKGQGADGKNSCKGLGSCATDGSKPPQ
jgi:hypothetical protein